MPRDDAGLIEAAKERLRYAQVDAAQRRIDPPAAPILTPQHFGAKGNGTTDDTAALRAWTAAIAGSMGYVPAGVYCYSESWALHSDTRIAGAGKSVARFKATNVTASITNANPRYSTAVDPDGGGDPIDHDIEISNVGFEGDPNAAVPNSVSFMAFVGVARLTFKSCWFRDRLLDLIILHNTSDVWLDGCRMSNWGKLTHPTPGDGQYVGGCAVFAWVYNERLRITNCDIHDGAGGLWLQDCPETILTGTRVWNTREFDVVGVGKRSVYAVNTFGRTIKVDVSGHTAEIHGEEFIYALNVHADAAGSNIYASNLRNALLDGNLCLRPGPGAAAITLASHGAWAGVGDPPECVTIAGNLCCDELKRAAHAVLVTDHGGGPVANVVVTDNNAGDKEQWTGKPVQVERKGVVAVHN